MYACTWFYIPVHVNYIWVLQDAHVLSAVFIDKDLGQQSISNTSRYN